MRMLKRVMGAVLAAAVIVALCGAPVMAGEAPIVIKLGHGDTEDTSFGGVHSSAERRARWGDAVAPGFVRLSVGCEPVEELWHAMESALEGAE